MLSRWNPDKHLRINSPRKRLALRMTWYCMVVSSIGGFLYSLPFLLDFPNPDGENIKEALILGVFFGGGTGLLSRLFASIFLGVSMALVSRSFFKTVTSPWAYRLTMGFVTAAVVHLFAPVQMVRFYLSELTAGDFDPRLEAATVIVVDAIAIYLSQFMAGKYMHEIAT